MNNTTALIDSEKRLGTLTTVTASSAELNLPQALAAAGRRGMARGTVGDFVFIDCDKAVILGRIIEVHIPEKNRPALEHQIEAEAATEPVGRIQLLSTIDKATQRVVRGISVKPRIGDGVYVAEGASLSKSIQGALLGENDTVAISLGQISGIDGADLSIPPEKLFGRHCGIFGATGGGKSWTLAKLIDEISRVGGKAILFDPTGEFGGKVPGATELAFTKAGSGQKLVHFPSERITELSLFALLRPTGQSQGPTMREAIRSLRLAKALKADSSLTTETNGSSTSYFSADFGTVYVDSNGCVEKSGKKISDFTGATSKFARALSSETCNFNIDALTDQIINECVYPTGYKDPNVFGGKNDGPLNYCNTLIVRMRSMLASPELQCLFGSDGEDICEQISQFLGDKAQRILLISFKNVSFNHNARELLLNTVGEYLLGLARADKFKKQPVVCFLDEAHQFMGQSVGDEYNSVSLDAFGLIAKEGRKYGLTTVIATQRPRDVPQDVLSQLGTLIVHRLTNDRDRETIERACGDLDRSAAAFIPSLGQGEAILVGPDLPAPLPIKITQPDKSKQPSSKGPDYQQYWTPADGSDMIEK
ncbi:MAG: ATP-binding protein [Rhodobacteraceae bacterium]|nr:ATP-binding protein [Paracoccaceae bacterium]